MSRELDTYMRHGDLPPDMQHFKVARAFGVNPWDVLNVWPHEMYLDALQFIAAEKRNAS